MVGIAELGEWGSESTKLRRRPGVSSGFLSAGALALPFTSLSGIALVGIRSGYARRPIVDSSEETDGRTDGRMDGRTDGNEELTR